MVSDPRNGNQKRVSIDRIKKYFAQDCIEYKDLIHHDQDYIKYQTQLFNTLNNYKVRTVDKDIDLDYTKYQPLQNPQPMEHLENE